MREKIDMGTANPVGEEKEMREDEAIYAADTNIITQHDTPKQISCKLLNYQEITSTRQVEISWAGRK